MITSTDYNQQATDFLTQTGTEFKAEFKKHGYHFTGDKEKRDIYTITLKRGDREYKFEFGASLNDSGFYVQFGRKRIDIDYQYLNSTNLNYIIKQKYQWDFRSNIDTIHKPVAPTAYSVLACLTKYDCGTFEDFCSEFGYDTDSKTAEKTYKAVCEEWLNVQRLFTDKEIELLQEIN